MPKVKLVIQGDIGPSDPWMEEYLGDDGMFSAEDCQKFLSENADATEVEVELRSNGGYADVAFDIHDQLRNSGKKIIMVGYNVKSAAVAIFLAADKEDRSLTKLAPFLIHKATIDPWLLGNMNTDQLAALATELQEYDNKLLDLYVERTGADRDVLSSEMALDKCITAERAKELGFCSTILDGQVENKVQNSSTRFITPMVSQLVQNNKNKTAMSDKKTEERLNSFQAAIDKILNYMSGKKLSSVKNSEEKSVYFEGEKIGKDTVLFEDEEKTKPVTAGEMTIGKEVITIGEGGVVSEVKEAVAENADVAKVKAELEAERVKNAQLLKEIADSKALVENSKTETAKMLADMKSDFENLKKDLIGDSGNPPKPKPENNKPMSIADMAAARAR
jgi:ATP-dependent protease ClpP protease subunit